MLEGWTNILSTVRTEFGVRQKVEQWLSIDSALNVIEAGKKGTWYGDAVLSVSQWEETKKKKTVSRETSDECEARLKAFLSADLVARLS